MSSRLKVKQEINPIIRKACWGRGISWWIKENLVKDDKEKLSEAKGSWQHENKALFKNNKATNNKNEITITLG